jgi:dipeptidyl aminopeptidase/acylaminoacyl peptidase
MTNSQTSMIQKLIQSAKKVIDIRNSADDQTIIYLASGDGVGELFTLDKTNKSKKVSQDLNIRGTVGYGGGEFDVSRNYYAVCDKSGNIFTIEPVKDHSINQVTFKNYQVSSPKISPDEVSIIFIYEQNEVGGIGITRLSGGSKIKPLITGSDFYMHPTWHPDGKMIAWVEWDHPYMPWDASRIKIGKFSRKQGTLTAISIIDGQIDESANQPLFSPNGKWLSFIKRNGNWDDLILYNLYSYEKKVVVHGNGFHLRMPDWVQGFHSYQWTQDSASIIFIKYHHGTSSLEKVNISTSIRESIDTQPYTWISQLSAFRVSDEIACIASSQSDSGQILRVSNKNLFPVSISRKMPHSNRSKGQEIVFPTKDGSDAYAWFYPPITPQKKGEIARCILNIHSGPTSVKHLGYSAETEIFTSQGFAVVYLNYHGSVTYGYDFQNALQRKWGEIEVQDSLCLINHLTSRGLVDSKKIAVMGSSAGGFSVLHLLIQKPGLFQAGVCSYAVSDLVDDAKHTHKFEKYYHRFLTGEFPAEYERFVTRSPLSHLDKIKDPLLLFHGSEDRVVSPNQSQKIFDSLSQREIPCQLKIYPEEGHGFRKQETIEDYYQTTFKFLNTYLK